VSFLQAGCPFSHPTNSENTERIYIATTTSAEKNRKGTRMCIMCMLMHTCYDTLTDLARPETIGTVIWPVQVVTEDIFIWTVRPQHSVNSFNLAV